MPRAAIPRTIAEFVAVRSSIICNDDGDDDDDDDDDGNDDDDDYDARAMTTKMKKTTISHNVVGN